MHNLDEITTVVLDVGGVLFVDMITPKIRDLAARHGIPESVLQQRRAELRPAVDLGTRSETEYWRTLLAQSGVTADERDLDLESYIREMPGMQAALRALAERYTLAILSNDSAELSVLRRSRLEAPISQAVISGEVGVMKPDLQIYRLLLERLDTSADSCLFLDDREENILAAQSVGMYAMQFESWDIVLRALSISQ